eukprot:COSAG05_NODE_3300_length_2165_cov_3.860116_3_plen_160_part_00
MCQYLMCPLYCAHTHSMIQNILLYILAGKHHHHIPFQDPRASNIHARMHSFELSSLNTFVRQRVLPDWSLSTCLPVNQSICQSIYLPIYLSIHASNSSTHLLIYLLNCVFISSIFPPYNFHELKVSIFFLTGNRNIYHPRACAQHRYTRHTSLNDTTSP